MRFIKNILHRKK